MHTLSTRPDRITFLENLPAPIAALVPEAEAILCERGPIAPFGLGVLRDIRPEAVLAWASHGLAYPVPPLDMAQDHSPDFAAIRDRAWALAPGGPLEPALAAASALSGVAYLGWGAEGVTAQGRHVVVGGCGEGSVLGVVPFRAILERMGCVGVYGDEARGVGGGYLPVSA